jgi:cytochrome c oxidase subunit 2
MLNAPRLAGQGGWYLRRQLENFKHGIRGGDARDSFGAQMAPMAAVLADDVAMANVVAYMESLPDSDPPDTISGDTARGEVIYRTCLSCHGAEGQGIWSQNAPRLNGINDWYLARQLENYRQGIRGSHLQDLYGKQMSLMSIMLRDEQAVRDVVAYINTL